MMNRAKWTCLALALLALASVPPAARAQDAERAGEGGDSEWVGPSSSEVIRVPGWTIKEELAQVEAHMGQFEQLIKTLGAANEDLDKDFQEFIKDPSNQLLGSNVERKMALYARRVIREFDKVLADQDMSASNFRNLRRKLGGFSEHLGVQSEAFKERLGGFKDKERELQGQLVELAVKIRETPPADERQLAVLKRQFAKIHRNHSLQQRYLRGYTARYKNYNQLKKNLEVLANLFVALHERYEDLVQNLETERQFMRDTVALQLDTLRIKRLMQENVLGGESALLGATEKLKKLYDAVEAFTQVNARINQNLSQFIEGEGQLVDLIQKIDGIGLEGGATPGDLNQDIEKAIDHFYGKRHEVDMEPLGDEEGEEELPGVDDFAEPAGAGER